MPDLTLYRDDIEALTELCGLFAAFFKTPEYRVAQAKTLRLHALLSDRLSQNLHPPRPASCDVCGRTAALRRANHPSIETYACADCIEGRPDVEEWTLQLNDYLEDIRGFGTTSTNARWYYRENFTVEEAAQDIARSYHAPDHNPDI